MIKIEKTEIYGWESAIRGMRNPMNSWSRSDSIFSDGNVKVGDNDLKLMNNLSKSGADHAKFMRFVTVTTDIVAPLYWWKEYDTYKVGTVANSCSSMHKILEEEFTRDDFSHEHLVVFQDDAIPDHGCMDSEYILDEVIESLNFWRHEYLTGYESGVKKDKRAWWQIIQLLPSSYNQKRTVILNYAVLRNMYHARKNHRLDEWIMFCEWIETLPYAKELIL